MGELAILFIVFTHNDNIRVERVPMPSMQACVAASKQFPIKPGDALFGTFRYAAQAFCLPVPR